ncbi:hypothetical protein AA13595_2393 [Gluconacetobacter johannae DSM 13595]|nr:hypothetical protein AA13595_2393 [Gluconacetobacter johannae DSM 13595]
MGVCSQYVPSSSRRSTDANRQTIGFRRMGVPRYSHVPSRWITNGNRPHDRASAPGETNGGEAQGGGDMSMPAPARATRNSRKCES